MNFKLSLPMPKAILCFILCLSGIVVFTTESASIQIACFLFQYIITVILMKVEFANPMIWYLGALTVYSIGYPLLYVLGIDVTKGLSLIPLRWCWIAYISFILSFDCSDTCVLPDSQNNYSWMNRGFFKVFIWISCVFVLSSIAMIRRAGYQNKGEIYSEGNIYINFAFSMIYIIQTLYVLQMQINYKLNNLIENKKLMIFVGSVSMLLTMFSGERDILIRFLVITMFSLYINHSITKKGIAILLVLLIILLPITGMLKYYFLSSQIGNVLRIDSIKSVISTLLVGEFESASKNLQILANDKYNSVGALGGITYISDITRIFGYAPFSALIWFNSKYYLGSRVGHGFTIVGEGIINFGVVGIIFNFLIISALLSYLYKNRYKNVICSTIYIQMIPVMVYSTRADFANILAPLFRQILLPLAVFGYLLKTKRI